MLLLSRSVSAALVLASTALIPTQAAYAQTQEIEVAADQDWKQRWTGVTFGSDFAGLARDQVTEFSPDQMNVAVQLSDAERKTSVTVYIYRAATPNISIWADRAVTAMLNNTGLGQPVEGQLFAGRFTPLNDSGSDSGFHAVSPMQGADTKATGVSLFAHDDWIIKVRASSSVLAESGVTALIGNVIAAMNLGASKTSYPPVEFIKTCDEGLDFADEVKITRFDLMGQLFYAPLSREISVADKGKDSAGESWCRDPQSSMEAGIYRKNGSERSYFAALGDSGLGAHVASYRDPSGFIKSRGYLIKTSDGVEEQLWPLFNKLPHAMAIAQNYGSIAPLSTTNVRPDGNGQTTILVSADTAR